MFLDFLVLIVITINTLLGVGVFLRNRQAKENRWYALFVLSLSLFLTSAFLENKPEIVGADNLALFLRIDFTAGILFSYTWLRFCLVFTKYTLKNTLRRWYMRGLAITGAALIGLVWFTPLIITNISFYDAVIHFDPGTLWFVYVAFTVSSMLGGLVLLFLKRKKTSEKIHKRYRRQLSFIMLGFLTSFGVATIIFLFLQTLSSISIEVAQLGLMGSIFLPMFTAYAITNYGLFQIKAAIAHLLVPLLPIFLFAQFLTAQTYREQVGSGGMVILSTFLSILLIREVNKEIRLRENIAHLSEHLRNFVATCTDKLRTPLHSAQTSLDLSLRYKKRFKDPYTSLAEINDELARIADLIVQLSNHTQQEKPPGPKPFTKKRIPQNNIK